MARARSYSFHTRWVLPAPPEAVWDVLHDAERYPRWWRGVLAVDAIDRGEANGKHSLARYRWRARLPYTVTFLIRVTEVRRPQRLAGCASGDLRGTGRWRLRALPDGCCEASFSWEVSTQKTWMNLLAPLLQPLLTANHDWLMRQGNAGLRRELGRRS